VAPLPNAVALKKSILSHHTPAEEVGRIAAAAGVKMVVLSHLIPAEDPGVTEEMWTEAVRRTYKGRVVVGRDLMEI
jgi:ribonuclease BN (tRNA processing enzyme)